MKSAARLLLLCTAVVSCSSPVSSDQEQIKDAILVFYNWYIDTTEDARYGDYVKAVEGDNGMSRLETTEYFKSLDSLGVMGPDFIKSEQERFKPCAEALKTIPWSMFNTGELYVVDKCDFFTYYYWIGGQETADGIDIVSVTIEKDKATAEVHPFAGKDKTVLSRFLVELKKNEGAWVISKIKRL